MTIPRFLPVGPQPQPQPGSPRLAILPPGAVPPVYVDIFLAASFTLTPPGGKMHFDTFDGTVRSQLYDTTNFWFACPRPGRYEFKVGVRVSNPADGEVYTADLYNNIGTVLLRRVYGLTTGIATDHSFSGSSVLPLKGGEQVFVNFTTTAGANRTIVGGSASTWQQITRVSDL